MKTLDLIKMLTPYAESDRDVVFVDGFEQTEKYEATVVKDGGNIVVYID